VVRQAKPAPGRKPHRPNTPGPPHETTAISQHSLRPGPRPEARARAGIRIPEFVPKIVRKVVVWFVAMMILVTTQEAKPETTIMMTCEITSQTILTTTPVTYP